MKRLLIGLFIWLCLISGASAALTATNLGTITTCASGSGTLTLATTVPIGSTVVVLINGFGGSALSIGAGDSQSNTYNQFGSVLSPNATSALGFAGVFVSTITTAMSSGDHIFAGPGSTTNACAVTAFMIAGSSAAIYNTGSINSSTGTGASPTVSVTPNFTNSMLIGFLAYSNSTSSSSTYTQASGYATPPVTTSGTSGTNTAQASGGNKIQATITSVTFSPTTSGGSPAYAVWLFEIPDAGGGGGTTSDQSLPLTGFGN